MWDILMYLPFYILYFYFYLIKSIVKYCAYATITKMCIGAMKKKLSKMML